MKKVATFLFVCLLMSSVALGLTATISGKTMMGPNYMVWGTVTGITTEAVGFSTGLTAIRAFGINNTTTPEAIKASVSGGTMSVDVETTTSSGSWWAIGR